MINNGVDSETSENFQISRWQISLSPCQHLPLQPCIIAECGEHKDGDSWGTATSDGSGDTHPDFPEDSDISFKDVSSPRAWRLWKSQMSVRGSDRSVWSAMKDFFGFLGGAGLSSNVKWDQGAISQSGLSPRKQGEVWVFCFTKQNRVKLLSMRFQCPLWLHTWLIPSEKQL